MLLFCDTVKIESHSWVVDDSFSLGLRFVNLSSTDSESSSGTSNFHLGFTAEGVWGRKSPLGSRGVQ